MAPPCYADLGKQARDLFNKNYHFGVVKLDCKTTTKTGVEFNVSGTSLNDTGKVNASLETKYKLSDLGLTLKEKWNTDNTLATEISCDDQLARGLKLAFNANFAPQTGKKSGALKTAYKVDNIHVNSDVDLGIGGPIAHAGAVLHYQGWLAGAQLSYDANKSRLSKTNFAVGYQGGDFVLHTNVNDVYEVRSGRSSLTTEGTVRNVVRRWNRNGYVTTSFRSGTGPVGRTETGTGPGYPGVSGPVPASVRPNRVRTRDRERTRFG
uniref:Putative voltage-dependent anion-selective channel n=1 Tax=Ixodes ricinus TaxID=34613 RepID=A0A0K8R727_IXORI